MSDSLKNPLVLIIDDDEVNRRVLQILLKHEAIDFLAAESGEEGLTLANNRHPDLILLDLLMPDADGFDTLRRLKNTPQLKEVPVIIFTIVEKENFRAKAFELGAADYMTKPFDMKELSVEIKKFLNR